MTTETSLEAASVPFAEEQIDIELDKFRKIDILFVSVLWIADCGNLL
jgi:hypothetical protein